MEELITKYMATNLITFKPTDDINFAMETIVKSQISGAPVVDSKGVLVGIISEKDCIRTIIDGPYNNMPSGIGNVEEYMSREVKTLDASITVFDAAMEFAQSSYRRFPVCQNGKLVGQISRRDILKAIIKHRPIKKQVPSSWIGREPMVS